MSDFKRLSRSVKGLTVLITGAASGMGRATAQVFAAEGATSPSPTSAPRPRRPSPTRSRQAAARPELDARRLRPYNITAVVNDVAAHFGGLDIVVNNAGISVRIAIDDDGYDEAWARDWPSC